MKLRKAIKKIVALGTGVAMVGATMVGAMAAADLMNYPAPFVKNGQFNAMIVVGDTAAPADIVGAIDVAASLQYNMRQTGYVSTGGSTSTTVVGGAKVETSAQPLWYEMDLASVKATFDSGDLAFLADGELTNENGTDFTYKQYLKNPYASVKWGEPDSELERGVYYLDFNSVTTANYTMEIQFPTSLDSSGIANEAVSFFGRSFTVSGTPADLTATKIVLFAAGLDQTFTAGDTTTVTVGNQDIDIEVIGVNTQSSTPTATVKVNGESKSISQLDNVVIGGVKVYVKDIFAYTAPVTSGAVRLFIGSDKMTLEDGNAVTTGSGDDEIDGTMVTITNSGGKMSKIAIDVVPYSVERGDDSWNYLLLGDEMPDPVFGTFKLAFTGMTPAVDDAERDYVKLWPSSTQKMGLTFTNRDGLTYSLNIINASYPGVSGTVSTDLNIDGKPFNIGATTTILGEAIVDEEYFLVGQGGYSRILQLKKIDTSNSKIKVKDVASGGTTNEYSYTVSGTSGTGTMTFGEGDYAFKVNAGGTAINITSNAANHIYTKGGLKINLSTADSAQNVTETQIAITEATEFNDASTSDETTVNATGATNVVMSFNVTLDWDGTNSKLTLNKEETLPGSFVQTGDGDDYTYATPYGTYMEYNSDSDTFEMSYYKAISSFDVSFAPVDGAVVAAGGAGSVETVTISKIAVGAAKLASEISNVAAQNLISVGGPCVNSVSAALMGNPSNCAAGFVAGSAKVKLFEQANGNVAMMVAGYSADDTKRATKVVSDFDQYSGFEGMEIEVSGTTMNDITISAPVVTTTTEAVTTTTEVTE